MNELYQMVTEIESSLNEKKAHYPFQMPILSENLRT